MFKSVTVRTGPAQLSARGLMSIMTVETRRLAMRLAPLLAFCALFGLTLIESQSVHRLEQESVRLHVEDQLATYQRALQLASYRNVDYLTRLAEQLAKSKGLVSEPWKDDVSAYAASSDGLLVLDWIAPDYSIQWRYPDDIVMSSTASERLFDPDYRTHLESIRRDASLSSSAELLSLQSRTVSVYKAILLNGIFAGWFAGVFDAADYLGAVHESVGDIDLVVSSGGEEIYRSDESISSAASGAVSLFVDSGVMGAPVLQLTAIATPTFVAENTDNLPTLILIFGFLISTTVAWIIRQNTELRARDSMLRVKDSEIVEAKGSVRTYSRAARRAEDSLEDAQVIANIGSWERDLQTGELSWSRQLYAVFEISPGREPLTPRELTQRVHPQDREYWLTESRLYMADGQAKSFIVRVQSKHGSYRHMRFTSLAVSETLRKGTVQDVTEQKELEERARNAEKLEALGQLTGGVAHDFNNILGIVSSTSQLIEMGLADDQEACKNLSRIHKAVERGALLTDQLLSFSRKQRLAPTQLDANQFVRTARALLDSKLGDEIELVLDTDDHLTPVHVDQHQLSDALLNLVLNSRDAIAGAGTITLAVKNYVTHEDVGNEKVDLESGEYVVFSVSDTGSGLSEVEIEKAFDPFFTTKNVGEGSGLGLSMVYGFAQQSGGQVSLTSERGKGTTVAIYLPAYTFHESHETKSKSCLVILEDNVDSARMTQNILARLGYETHSVGDVAAAIRLLQAGAAYDAALLDVNLPHGLTVSDVAVQLKNIVPEMQVVCTTGCSADEIARKFRYGEDHFAQSDQLDVDKPESVNAVLQQL